MFISECNFGFGFSSMPYTEEIIPEFWFDLLDNLSEIDRDSVLESFSASNVLAIWYDQDGKHEEAVNLAIDIRRRFVSICEIGEDEDKARYFVFNDKPFDIRVGLTADEKGIIWLNSCKPEPNQLFLGCLLGNETSIELFNSMVLLLSYGDKLLEKGYPFIKVEPVYCKSFKSVAGEVNIDFEEAVFEFYNVKCLSVETSGKIKHSSISNLVNMEDMLEDAAIPVGKQTILDHVHRLAEFSLERPLFNETRERATFRPLEFYNLIHFRPKKYPYFTNLGANYSETMADFDGLSFTDLYMCERIGAVPERNTIVLFGKNHYERFEFTLFNKDDFYDFGQLVLFFRKLYVEINNELAMELGCYNRMIYEDKEDTGFFLKNAERTDENFFIDLDEIKYVIPCEVNTAYTADCQTEEPEDGKNAGSALDQLNTLTGLAGVKKDVLELSNLVKLNLRRREMGLPEVPVSLHLVFTGNPGTGKTTVARILAQLYREIGVLSRGQLVETDRAGLVAGYVGQTALKTQEKINEAMGGILFIDEAYTLVKEGTDFGQEAIDTILKAMEDNRDDFVVIVAGYPELMSKFINSNPGLKSRFNKYFYFEDYNADELFTIFMGMCGKYHYHLTDEAEVVMKEKISRMVAEKDANFANARDIRNMFEGIITRQANRIATINNPTADEMLQITAEDLA